MTHAVYALVAQLVEQRTENPRVTGSIPVLGIFAALFSVPISATILSYNICPGIFWASTLQNVQTPE